VAARGELRHDPAVLRVELDLRRDDVRADAAAVFDDSDGGLIAGGFDAEDEQEYRRQELGDRSKEEGGRSGMFEVRDSKYEVRGTTYEKPDGC
jgi:hypothetical protein